MKLLVTGATGQVGWELVRSLLPLGEVVACDRTQCDFMRPDSLADVVARVEPDVIVNAAAYTAVDKAESEEARAQIVNGEAVKALASASAAAGALLVHYSTDYVFDGRKDAAYVEGDEPNPINVYGRSKLAGERAIVNSGCDYLIFRTGWVYAARGRNFVRTILRLAGERDELDVVADQIGTPNWARNIADVTAQVIGRVAAKGMGHTRVADVYHLTASGSVSWHGFAEAILDVAEQHGLLRAEGRPVLRAVTTEVYPRPAARPKNSRLAADRLKERFGVALPDWRKSLDLCMQELIGENV